MTKEIFFEEMIKVCPFIKDMIDNHFPIQTLISSCIGHLWLEKVPESDFTRFLRQKAKDLINNRDLLFDDDVCSDKKNNH